MNWLAPKIREADHEVDGSASIASSSLPEFVGGQVRSRIFDRFVTFREGWRSSSRREKAGLVKGLEVAWVDLRKWGVGVGGGG